MKVKYYNNEIKEINPGYPLDAYFSDMSDVMEYSEDGIKWVVNSGYNLNTTIEKLNTAIERKRQSAYQQESDPLFFKFKRGEATEQNWLDKIAEIKARFQKNE